MALPDPERARGWIATLLPLAERAGPLLTLVIALIAGLTVWYLLGALAANRAYTVGVIEKLLACQEARVDLARQCRAVGSGE